jgi:tetratricopeptide (TPR) repeat protein
VPNGLCKTFINLGRIIFLFQWSYAGESDTFYFKPETLVYDTAPQKPAVDSTQNTLATPSTVAKSSKDMKTDPHYEEYKTYNLQGHEHLKNGEYEDAIFNFQKALELNPNDAAEYNNLGSVYSQQGDTTAAMENLNKAIDLDSTLASAYYNRGILNYTNDSSGEAKNKLALADYTQAIALDSTQFDAYYSRGLVYSQLKENNNALADFTQAIALNPDSYDAYVKRGNTYSLTTENTLALADYDKALDIKPFNSQIYLKKAEVYVAMKQKDDAIEEYKKVIFYAKTEDEDLKNVAAAMIKKLQGK